MYLKRKRKEQFENPNYSASARSIRNIVSAVNGLSRTKLIHRLSNALCASALFSRTHSSWIEYSEGGYYD